MELDKVVENLASARSDIRNDILQEVWVRYLDFLEIFLHIIKAKKKVYGTNYVCRCDT